MTPTIAAQFFELFQGSSHKHGHSELLEKRRADGKQEAKCWTADGPATEQLWRDHLSGRRGLGIVPIRRGTNDCRFGAIDIDKYNGQNTAESILKIVNESNIPIAVCRSKSGGLHLYLFTSEWVPAALMREKLETIAAFLGYSSAEIFPAQSELVEGTSDGNWINMPYYGENSLRYAYNRTTGISHTPAEFLSDITRFILSRSELERLSSRDAKVEPLFAEGPPCLEDISRRIIAGEISSDRNTIALNVSVYANIRWPGDSNRTTREAFVVKINNLFPEPLSLAELTKTIFAQDKRGKSAEYKYQCSRCPLKSHCNPTICRTRRYGIGAYNGTVIHTLAKVETDPPYWLLKINEQQIPLTTEELFMHSKVQQRVAEKTNMVIQGMKASDWQEVLRDMMKSVHTIHVFKESSDVDDIKEKISLYLYERSQTDDVELSGVNSGNVIKTNGRAYFLPEFINTYLKNKGVDIIKQKKLIEHTLATSFEASEERPNKLKPRRRCYVVPVKFLNME